jgi:hypothetical protein
MGKGSGARPRMCHALLKGGMVKDMQGRSRWRPGLRMRCARNRTDATQRAVSQLAFTEGVLRPHRYLWLAGQTASAPLT